MLKTYDKTIYFKRKTGKFISFQILVLQNFIFVPFLAPLYFFFLGGKFIVLVSRFQFLSKKMLQTINNAMYSKGQVKIINNCFSGLWGISWFLFNFSYFLHITYLSQIIQGSGDQLPLNLWNLTWKWIIPGIFRILWHNEWSSSFFLGFCPSLPGDWLQLNQFCIFLLTMLPVSTFSSTLVLKISF